MERNTEFPLPFVLLDRYSIGDQATGRKAKLKALPGAHLGSRKLSVLWQLQNLHAQIIIERPHAKSLSEIGRRLRCFQIVTPSVKMATVQWANEAFHRIMYTIDAAFYHADT
jgi:hypothetical protein